MPSHSTSAAPFRDVIDESVDEAAFLWRAWERELASLTRNLDEIRTWTEDRLQGALDGIRAAGGGLTDILAPEVESADLARVTPCAAVLASSTEPAAMTLLSRVLEQADDARLDAVVRALEVMGTRESLRVAAAVLAGRGPIGAGALCRLKAFHRGQPGGELQAAMESGVPALQVAALSAVLHANSTDHDALVATALQSADPSVRAKAVEVGACRGLSPAWSRATTLARALDAGAAPLLTPMGLLGTAEDHELVFAALRVPALQRAAIWATGHIGTVQAIDVCLAGMRHEPLARACGEAYAWITGADLVRDRLALPEPAADSPSLEADDLDADLVPHPEALWPLPDAEAVHRHWQERAATFAPEVRHIHGRPATGEWLLTMIERGPMLRRPDLVLELRVRTHRAYDVETRAHTGRQRAMMAASRAAVMAPGGR